jgi:uncharacterized protein YciI
MSLFAVIREAGPGWIDGGAFDQPQVNDHAAFMDALAGTGFVHFAGPLAGSERGRLRAQVIVDAENEAEIHRRLAEDPWATAQLLDTVSVEPWSLFVGADRLPVPQPAAH